MGTIGGNMRLISLFSGAGGFDYGFHKLGLELASANDIKLDGAKTYYANYGVPINIAPTMKYNAYTVWNIMDTTLGYTPTHDVILVGGPPCQDFSIARGGIKRKGAQTMRGKLYLHFARYLAIAQPVAFVFENVPGITSSNGGNDIKAILHDLANPGTIKDAWVEQYALSPETTPPVPEDVLELNPRRIEGYTLIRRIVDMSAHGVPQKRKRLIIVGLRNDLLVKPDHIRAIEDFLAGDPIFRQYPVVAMEALEGKVITELQDEYQTLRKEYGYRFGTDDVVKDYLAMNGEQGYIPDEALEAHRNMLVAMGWYGRSLLCGVAYPDGTHTRPRESEVTMRKMANALPGDRSEAHAHLMSHVYRKLHPLKPSYTIVAHGGGGTHGYHYSKGIGRLTNRERARLQGYPDAFVFYGTYKQVRAQIGESVPPIFSIGLAKAMVEVLADISHVCLRTHVSSVAHTPTP